MLFLLLAIATGLPLRAQSATPLATTADRFGSGVTKFTYPTADSAADACWALARTLGGTVVRTSGTPSMEPLIHGVAFAVITKRPYGEIKKSDILVYMGLLDPRRTERTCTLHRAVSRDRAGWLMSGDNNRWSESWDRVTPDNYLGTVVTIFEAQAG